MQYTCRHTTLTFLRLLLVFPTFSLSFLLSLAQGSAQSSGLGFPRSLFSLSLSDSSPRAILCFIWEIKTRVMIDTKHLKSHTDIHIHEHITLYCNTISTCGTITYTLNSTVVQNFHYSSCPVDLATVSLIECTPVFVAYANSTSYQSFPKS